MTRVLLIRHGQSEWNADGRWQGQADPPLTELGRHQAQHASRSLGVVDVIVTSDLQRASETAAIIGHEIGVGPVILDRDLRERQAGEWEGLTRAQIEREWPGYLGKPRPVETAVRGDGPAAQATAQAEQSTHPERRPPGWEPDEALVERGLEALGRIHAMVPDGTAIVVTHGGLVYALEGEMGAGFVRLPNLGGRWLELGPEGPVSLGERVLLVDPDEVTIPNQI